MSGLDANYLIDYLSGEPAAEAYYDEQDGPDELWIMPAPAHAEALIGVGNHPTANLDEAIDALAWGDVYTVDEELSFSAARIADEIGLEGPYLDGVDALVAAVGRQLDAPVVSADSDLTHEATKEIIDIEEYWG